MFVSIFRHLKLELLTQFPASNDEKYHNVRRNWHPVIIILLITTIVVFNLYY